MPLVACVYLFHHLDNITELVKTSIISQLLSLTTTYWCPWPESNRHALRRQILSLLCLPIPPHGQNYLPYFSFMVPETRVELVHLAAADFKSAVSTFSPLRHNSNLNQRKKLYSITSINKIFFFGVHDQIRTGMPCGGRF
jgi:hypothetical protein